MTQEPIVITKADLISTIKDRTIAEDALVLFWTKWQELQPGVIAMWTQMRDMAYPRHKPQSPAKAEMHDWRESRSTHERFREALVKMIADWAVTTFVRMWIETTTPLLPIDIYFDETSGRMEIVFEEAI